MSTYPRSFSHIGISVPDLEAAVKFYTEVLGWYLIMPPTEITEDDSAIGAMCTDVFGAGWERFRIAHLSTGDRIGVELAARAGYDPRAAVGLWKKMESVSGGQPPQWLSTHPSHDTRQQDLAQYAARVMPLYQAARNRR